jgi:hypothetical protein
LGVLWVGFGLVFPLNRGGPAGFFLGVGVVGGGGKSSNMMIDGEGEGDEAAVREIVKCLGL